MTFDLEKIAREYTLKRFPLSSKAEQEKFYNDWVKKLPIARKVAQDFLNRVGPLKDKKVIDMGSGNGFYSIAFAEQGAKVTAVEVEQELHDISKENFKAHNIAVEALMYDGVKLPLEDDSIDYAISFSVLEHVDDAKVFLTEILRVIKPGGKFFLAFPNKYWPRESHTGLWFVTWLPAFFRPFMIRLFKKAPLEQFNLHFYSFFDFKKIIDNSPVNNLYWRIKEEEGKSTSVIKTVLRRLLKVLGINYKAILPNISVVLEKKI